MTSLRQNWEPALSKIVSLAVAKIKSEAITGSADIYKWWTLMTADVIGLLAFGETFQMTESGQVSSNLSHQMTMSLNVAIDQSLH